MKTILVILKECFWGFGKPKSEWQRRFRIANRTIAIGCCLWVALLLFPQVLFAHSYTYQNYTIYSRDPLPPETGQVLKRADELLRGSELYSQERRHKVFLCNSTGLFTLFNPRQRGVALGTSHPTGHIFIQHGKPEEDLTWKNHDPGILRSLSGLVAHEVTHNLVRDHLGLIGSYRLPVWKNEGYAEFIAMHGQHEYEHRLDDGREGEFTTFYIHPRYREHLARILAAFPDGNVRFEDLRALE